MMKYYRVLAQLTRMSVTRTMAYRPSLFFGIVAKAMRLMFYLAFADAMFRHIPALGAWSQDTVPLLVLSLFIVELLCNVSFQRNLLLFFPSRYLRKGLYDFIITKPMSTMFLTCFAWGIDFFDFMVLVPALGFMVWLLVVHGVSLSLIMGYWVLIGAACLIWLSFSLLGSAINFWTLLPSGLVRWHQTVQYLNRFSLDALPWFWRTVVFYIIPIAVAGNIPAKYVLGTWSNAGLLYIVGFSVVLFFIARKFWYYGLRHYSSAS